MANGFSLPPWLIPQRSPWEALLAGVQAGSAIAATRQRGQQLGMQLRHQAFQEEASKAKFDSDQQDLATLQQWWPSFTTAEGESLRTLQAPPLKNAQMWNRITMELERKKQQAAASEFANIVSTENLATPEGQAKAWRASRGLVPPEQVSGIIGRQVTATRMENDALETARHNLATEEIARTKTERQEFDVFFDANTKRWYQWRNNAAYPVTSEEIKSLSPSTRASIYKQQIEEAEQAIRVDVPTDDKKLLKVWQDKLDEARKNRDAMLKTEGQASAPESPKRIRVREKTTGKTGWWEGGPVPTEYETIPE
jgi:hypothetical protein